jgi:hypothetical protein
MSFKSFDLAHDVGSVVSAMNEVLTISSSLFSGSAGDPNVKTYNNIASGTMVTQLGGYWQTVYDSSPSSIQSTALFDLTFGFSTGSQFYGYAQNQGGTACYQEKNKVYKEMASVLLGGSDRSFGPTNTTGTWNECFFIMVKRGIQKDELKKGVMAVTLLGSSPAVTGTDTGAAANYKQTVGGDYAPLLSGSTEIGQVWYNAGIIIVPASATALPWVVTNGDTTPWSGSLTVTGSNLYHLMSTGTIDNVVTGLRAHISNLAFQNQTNLYSTIYFCRATNTEFNYSSNPTYVDSSQRILVTSGSNILQSRTYITKIGLYDANDNLLAVGSVNKPITKSPDTESIYRVRLDY